LVDVWYDGPRDRHLVRLTLRHEAILQVDQDKRRAGRIDPLEGMRPATAQRDTLGDPSG
jgi:hypothetical protein